MEAVQRDKKTALSAAAHTQLCRLPARRVPHLPAFQLESYSDRRPLARFAYARAGVVVDNEDMATGMEKKEQDQTADIFWSREPIMGPKGTKEKPAIVPSYNTSRVVGLETEQVRASLISRLSQP